jgi:N-succinyldiaminopimelate aminotransferase
MRGIGARIGHRHPSGFRVRRPRFRVGAHDDLPYTCPLAALANAIVNPRLSRLKPYPFERLRLLLADVAPRASLAPINLSIGEPRHPTPPLVLDALAAGGKGLANYPTTIGAPALRDAIAGWLVRRHGLAQLDPATQVLPVLGSREALFAFA